MTGTLRQKALVALLGLLFAGPLAVLGLYAVAPGWNWPDLWPARFDARALEYVWAQAGPMSRHMLVSVGYSLATAMLSFVLCLAPARHFARHEFAGRALLEGVLLAPALVPPMAFSMGVHTTMIRLGLAGTTLGVVLVLTTFAGPYMLRALTAGFQAFGPEYDQCARNLGAGRLTRLWRVELPLLLPAAIAGGSVVFLVAFSEYFLVFLIGGGQVDSFTGYLFPMLNSSDRSIGSALTLIFVAVPLALFVLIELVVGRAYRRRGM